MSNILNKYIYICIHVGLKCNGFYGFNIFFNLMTLKFLIVQLKFPIHLKYSCVDILIII